MNPRITEIASYLASRIPTGSDDPDEALQDWRLTLYNAKATASLRPLTDMISRSTPDDPIAAAYCEALRRR